MKHFISILALGLLASCTAAKRTTSVSVTETTRSDSQVVDRAVKYTSERIERDTVLTIAYREVRDTVEYWHIDAGKHAGKPVYREKTSNGLKAWVNIDGSGNVSFGASSDSFNVVVKGLIRERDSFKGLYRQQHFIHNTVHASSLTETQKTKQTFAGWALNNIYWIVPALIVLYLIYSFIAKKFPF